MDVDTVWSEFSNANPTVYPSFPTSLRVMLEQQNTITQRYIKWRMPPSCSTDGAGTSKNSAWDVNVIIPRHFTATTPSPISACVQCLDNPEQVNVPIQSLGSFATQDQSYVEDRFNIQLGLILNDFISDDGTVFVLKIFINFEDVIVAQFEIKDIKIWIEVVDESYTAGQINVRDKKQQTTGKSKSRLQRLDKKDLKFSLRTSVKINEPVRGFVKREAIIRSPKAVTSDIQVPLECTNSRTDDEGRINYSFTADLDPEEFYDNNRGKELYTSDKSSPNNNIFQYYICVSVHCYTAKEVVYRFTTKSKERPDGDIKEFLRIEAKHGRIKNLSIETLKTERGDIAYTWKLMNPNTAGSYEEGDIVGLFSREKPKDVHGNDDKTFIDHLTPKNCKKAIAAGVITRSYYLNANSQEDGEKLCMVGMVKVKVSGAVKHGDFIYASNELPGVAVTWDRLIAGKGNWREKRLLGTSLETNQETGVKLVNCIVSLLVSISNDGVECVLSQLDDKIDRFRDEVSTSKKASRRRKGFACLVIVAFLLLAMVACYIFLCPTSPYNKWKCRRGSLPGILTFHLVNHDSEEYIDMSGALYTWRDLKYRLDLQFHHNQDFNGSYYLNLRRCQSENLRRVLGWFSNPPVYLRAQVFLVNCNCTRIFHYQKYETWQEYKLVFHILCHEEKGPYCRKKVDEETTFHHSQDFG